jgi:hypothetical protein
MYSHGIITELCENLSISAINRVKISSVYETKTVHEHKIARGIHP